MSQKILRLVIFLILIFSFIGFWDAFYLTVLHYRGEAPICTVFEGCQKVTSSPYAVVGGVPVALLGVFYYLAVFLLSIIHLLTSEGSLQGRCGDWVKRGSLMVIVSRLTIIGFIFSLWFVYIQLFVLKAICVYCMISAFSSTVLFGLGRLIARQV